MFTMTDWDGKRVSSVTWDDGKLSGDPYLVLSLEVLAEHLEGRRVGPPEGPHTVTNHLRSGLTVVILAEQVFPYRFTATGDVPTRGDHSDLA